MAESKGWYATCPEAATPPPTEWRRWDDLPHRLFFAHSSPTWDGGGVAFVDFGEDLRGSPGRAYYTGVPGVLVKPEVEPKPKPPSRTSHNERNVAERPASSWAKPKYPTTSGTLHA